MIEPTDTGVYSKLMGITQNNRGRDNMTTRQHVGIPTAQHDNIPTTKQSAKQTNNTVGSNGNDLQNDHTAKRSNLIEDIRVVVKDNGSEWSGFRFTEAEKEALYDLRHQLRKLGYKNVSDNLLVRIALGNLLSNFREAKKDSVVVAVLERLNA